VPQDSKEENAADLLARIVRSKTNANDTGKKARVTGETSTHEPPHPVPQSWRWARFDAIATIKSNLVPPAEFPDHPHVAPNNIEKATGRLLEYRTVQEDGVRSGNHRFFSGQ